MQRPRIKILKSKIDLVVEVVSFSLIGITTLLIGLFYSQLPDEIPIPFNWPTKDSDGFAEKSVLWMNPLIGGTIVTLLYILKQFPWIFNYPVQITKKNARAMYGIATQLLQYSSLIVSVIFFLMSLQPILVLFYKTINFIAIVIPILVLSILALIVIAVIKMIMLKTK